MDETAIRRRLKELLAVNTEGSQGSSEVFQGALHLLAAIYGPESPQVKDLQVVAAPHPRFGTDLSLRGDASKGALQNLQGDLDAGLVGSLRAQVAGGVIADFLGLARHALDEPGDGAKNVAAVLAGAVYEDTIRRMGAELAGVVGRPNLADVLGALKSRGILIDTQFSIAQSYLSFRNNALHADWGKVERASIVSVLGFVEQLLLKHFS